MVLLEYKIPKKMRATNSKPQDSPENKIFDKADEAESVEKQKKLIKDTEGKIKELNEQLKTLETEEEKANLQETITQLKGIKERMMDKVDQKITEISENK